MSGLCYEFECLLIFTQIQMFAFGFHSTIEIHFSTKCLVFVISLKSFVSNFIEMFNFIHYNPNVWFTLSVLLLAYIHYNPNVWFSL